MSTLEFESGDAEAYKAFQKYLEEQTAAQKSNCDTANYVNNLLTLLPGMATLSALLIFSIISHVGGRTAYVSSNPSVLEQIHTVSLCVTQHPLGSSMTILFIALVTVIISRRMTDHINC